MNQLANAESLLQIAGALQLLQAPAIAVAHRSLGWSGELAALSPLGRRLVYTVSGGIFFYVTGTGLVSVLCAGELARTQLGFGFCLVQLVTWWFRAFRQMFALAPVWPASGRWLLHGMNGFYSVLALIYAAICLMIALAKLG